MRPGGVLITGAARRIGKALALSLGAKGFAVAVHYGTSKAEAEAVAKTIKDAGGKGAAVGADLLSWAETESLVAKAEKALGQPVTVLINNAAAFLKDDLETLSKDTARKNLKTNLEAPMLLSKNFAAALPKGETGVIINIIDQRVLNLTTGFLSYTVSKHALWALTRILALDLAPHVRVNAIGPGPTLQSVYQTEEGFAHEAAGTPLGHGPGLKEMAAAVDFIIATPSMTGQMIALDGGQHLL